MGINVRIETENGRVLDEYLDPDGRVSRLAERAHRETSRWLRFIDPYGNTTFNRFQFPELILEVELAARESEDSGTVGQ